MAGEQRFDVAHEGFSAAADNDKLPEAYSELANQKFGENVASRREKLQELRDKLLFVPDVLQKLPEDGSRSDDFLLMFLRVNDFDVEAAVKMIVNFREMLRSYPAYFKNAFEQTADNVQYSSRNLMNLLRGERVKCKSIKRQIG